MWHTSLNDHPPHALPLEGNVHERSASRGFPCSRSRCSLFPTGLANAWETNPGAHQSTVGPNSRRVGHELKPDALHSRMSGCGALGGLLGRLLGRQLLVFRLAVFRGGDVCRKVATSGSILGPIPETGEAGKRHGRWYRLPTYVSRMAVRFLIWLLRSTNFATPTCCFVRGCSIGQ